MAQLTVSEILSLARKHIGSGSMVSSARLCLSDAVSLADKGELGYARIRAVDSLKYSVGIFHADYRLAAAPYVVRDV